MRRWSAVALMVFASVAAAADAGLDLALLVDRSTSMARRSRNQDELFRMTLDLLARNAAANRIEHRVAVIGFGSSASVDVPFTPVAPADLERLRTRVDALRYEDRGDTDVLAAFTRAEKLFRALPRRADRRRAIVLVTDGVPYVRGADMQAYRARLENFARTRLARDGITIDVLLLDAKEDGPWATLARVERVETRAEQFLPAAHGVIARLVGTRTAESAPAKTRPAVDTLIVPPYLEVIVFDIFRGTRGAGVEIVPSGSTTSIRAGVNGVESIAVGDTLMTLVVPHPSPGEWLIRKSQREARVRVLSQQFFPRGMLMQPAETETLRRCSRVPIAYRVLDGAGRPLQELSDYALALEVTLAKPQGTSSAIPMERDTAMGAGGFRSAHNPLCDREGRYWTDVRITTADAKGHRLEVFRDRWSGFSVPPSSAAECKATLAAAVTSRAPAKHVSRLAIVIGAVLLATAATAFVWRRRKTDS